MGCGCGKHAPTVVELVMESHSAWIIPNFASFGTHIRISVARIFLMVLEMDSEAEPALTPSTSECSLPQTLSLGKLASRPASPSHDPICDIDVTRSLLPTSRRHMYASLGTIYTWYVEHTDFATLYRVTSTFATPKFFPILMRNGIDNRDDCRANCSVRWRRYQTTATYSASWTPPGTWVSTSSMMRATSPSATTRRGIDAACCCVGDFDQDRNENGILAILHIRFSNYQCD